MRSPGPGASSSPSSTLLYSRLARHLTLQAPRVGVNHSYCPVPGASRVTSLSFLDLMSFLCARLMIEKTLSWWEQDSRLAHQRAPCAV